MNAPTPEDEGWRKNYSELLAKTLVDLSGSAGAAVGEILRQFPLSCKDVPADVLPQLEELGRQAIATRLRHWQMERPPLFSRTFLHHFRKRLGVSRLDLTRITNTYQASVGNWEWGVSRPVRRSGERMLSYMRAQYRRWQEPFPKEEELQREDPLVVELLDQEFAQRKSNGKNKDGAATERRTNAEDQAGAS